MDDKYQRIMRELAGLSERQELVLDAVTIKRTVAAIEELSALVADKEYLTQQQAEEIKRLRGAVKNQREKMFVLAAKLPKKGKWAVRIDQDDKPLFRRKFVCSACGEWTSYGMSDYCPNCGADMREVQE